MSENYQKAYNYCLFLLGRRDYLQSQLVSKMKQKGYSEETRQEVITRLNELNYIQEDKYIEARVKSLLLKNYSNYYIINKLSQNQDHIDQDKIEEIKSKLDLNEHEAIKNLILKKLRSLNSEDDMNKKKEKIIRFLASKGHRVDFSLIDNYLI